MKQQVFHRASVFQVAFIGSVAFLCSVFISCEFERTKIPDCTVYLKRDIYNEGLFPTKSFLYVTTPQSDMERLGYAGIVIVHCDDLEEPYCAFDLGCPNCVSPSIRVGVPDSITMVCVCPDCGEHYDLFFGLGNPTKRISKVGMKKYTTYIDPFNYRNIIVEP